MKALLLSLALTLAACGGPRNMGFPAEHLDVDPKAIVHVCASGGIESVEPVAFSKVGEPLNVIHKSADGWTEYQYANVGMIVLCNNGTTVIIQ